MGYSDIPPFRPLTVDGSLADLEDGKVAMSLNEPPLVTEGDFGVVDGPVTVRGWAHARGGIEAVLVVLDGARYEALRPIVRTDLLDYYGADAAAEGGFVLRLHETECPPGTHRLAVVAIGRDGDVVGVEGDIVRRDALDTGTRVDPAPPIDWIEDRTTPQPAPIPHDPHDEVRHAVTAGDASPETLERLRGLALEWESRALLAEADAAASRVEVGLASTQQEAAIRMLREARRSPPDGG